MRNNFETQVANLESYLIKIKSTLNGAYFVEECKFLQDGNLLILSVHIDAQFCIIIRTETFLGRNFFCQLYVVCLFLMFSYLQVTQKTSFSFVPDWNKGY